MGTFSAGYVVNEHARWRVVVVDDHPDARALIGRALERSGEFEMVGEADDGVEGIAVARRCQPDVVLLDLNMPRMDGLTALPEVQKACPPHTIVMVMSVQHTPDRGELAIHAGAAGFFTKEAGYRRLVEDLLGLVGDTGPVLHPKDHAMRWHLPPDLESGRRARQRLRGLLADWGLDGLRDEVELLTTELVNNAVVHAHSEVLLSVRWRDDALRVEVTDVGAGTPHRPEHDITATHGRGLLLVDAVSAAWGTAVDGAAKTVWFELSVTD